MGILRSQLAYLLYHIVQATHMHTPLKQKHGRLELLPMSVHYHLLLIISCSLIEILKELESAVKDNLLHREVGILCH